MPSNSWGGGIFYAALPAVLLALISASPGPFFIGLILFTLIFKFSPISFRLRLLPTSKISSFQAVKNVSYSIDKNSLFVLLGHNGAGKSTTFNMLTGLMPQSGGDAKILGFSVKNEMNKISQIMGVCNRSPPTHLPLFVFYEYLYIYFIHQRVLSL